MDDVRRLELQLNRPVDRQAQQVDRHDAVRVRVLPVELVCVDLDDERIVALRRRPS